MLSVITPVFNQRKTLSRVIECLIRLTRLIPCELILIDDKSTDGSAEYIQSVMSQSIDLKKIFLKANSGPGAARNAGLNVASKKYVMFLDSDDEIIFQTDKHRNNIRKILSLLESSVDIVRLGHNKGEWLRASANESAKDQECHTLVIDKNPEILDQIPLIECWGYIIRRRLITTNNIRFLETRIAEDQPFITEVFLNAETYSETSTLNYVHYGNSTGAATSIRETSAGDYLQAIDQVSILKAQALSKRKIFLENIIQDLTRFLPWYCLPYLQDEGWLDQSARLNSALQAVFTRESKDRGHTAPPTEELKRLAEKYVAFGREYTGRIYLYGLSPIAVSLVELFQKSGLGVHTIVDDYRKHGMYRGIPLIKLEDLNQDKLEPEDKDGNNIMLVTQLVANVAIRLANRADRDCRERFQSIWMLDDSFKIRKFEKSMVPLK